MAMLLCELHAHTTWSDGALSVRELVDLYGRSGFDVLCVTDHAVPPGDFFLRSHRALDGGNWPAYLRAIGEEAERARELYDLLLVPGVELSENGESDETAHAVVLGLDGLVSLDDGVVAALRKASAAGAAVIAAHPYDLRGLPLSGGRPTRRLWREWQRLVGVVHRWELFNQNQLFPWVAEARLPAVASGDFHVERHLPGWKTLLPCLKDPRAVVDCLRSPARASLVPVAVEELIAA